MPPGRAFGAVFSSSVFQAPQASHLPCHLGKMLPHAAQTNWWTGLARVF